MKINELILEQISKNALNIILTPEVKKLGNLFEKNGFELRIVGGAVRDILLGRVPKDLDFCSDALPNEMIEFLENSGWRTIPTGLQHGTISVIGSRDEPYEITTLRIDKETFGRQAEVEFTRDFKEDAKRRDLTFNAMSIDMDGNIYDYYGGIQDLKNNKVQFVGNSDDRIKEDYLRILRYFRFLGRMRKINVDNAILKAIKDNAIGLKQISGERIWAEMQKILMGNNVEEIIKLICELEVAKYTVIPCNYSGLSKIQTTNPITKLSFLTNDLNAVEQIIERWKLSNIEKDLYKFLVQYKNQNIDIIKAKQMVVNKVPKEFIFELYNLKSDRNSANIILNWHVPVFPITGTDLINLGYKPGPEMGQILSNLKQKWINSGYELTKEQLLNELE